MPQCAFMTPLSECRLMPCKKTGGQAAFEMLTYHVYDELRHIARQTTVADNRPWQMDTKTPVRRLRRLTACPSFVYP